MPLYSKLYPAYAEPLNAPLGGGTSNANAQDSLLIAKPLNAHHSPARGGRPARGGLTQSIHATLRQAAQIPSRGGHTQCRFPIQYKKHIDFDFDFDFDFEHIFCAIYLLILLRLRAHLLCHPHLRAL